MEKDKNMKIAFMLMVFGLFLISIFLSFVSAEISPSLNMNGQHRFTIQNYTIVSAENITLVGNSTGGGYGYLCITPNCDHSIHYNGTATIIS